MYLSTSRARTSFLGVSLLFVAQLLLLPHASAVEFVIVGPRAIGMGGAGVATTTDALATYWNPAALAMSKEVDVKTHASFQGVDRLGMRQTLDDLGAIDLTDPASLPALLALASRLNGASLSLLAAAGLYAKGYWGRHAFGVNISDVATGGLYTPGPILITGPCPCTINGSLQGDLLEARQVGVSFATSVLDDTMAIGVTGKIIQGAAYSNPIAAIDATGKFNFTADLGKANISTELGVDVGAVYRPFDWFRVGVVAKDLNEPTFNTPSGGKFRLAPQVRAGVAVNPHESLTIAFDGDLTANKTLVPGVKSRVLGLGAETVLMKFISLRVGALKNVKDSDTAITPTAGLGLSLFALHFDAGGGYDFDEGQALVGFSLSMEF